LADPGALARDWDVLIFCGYGFSWNPGWRAPIRDFVSTYGKEFPAVMDYEGADMPLVYTRGCVRKEGRVTP
jgi:hypothetical protein